jgi:hypothetical protein
MKIFLSVAVLLLLSCSFVGVRAPAEKFRDQALTIDDILSIKNGNHAASDLQAEFMKFLNLNENIVVRAEAEASNNLPNDIAFRLQFEIIEDKYVLKIIHSKNAFKDSDAVYELSHLIKKIASGTGLQNPLSLFEMYYNAHEGDMIALDNFLKIKTTDGVLQNHFIERPEDYQQRLAEFAELRKDLASGITTLKKQRKLVAEKRKALMDELDKAPDSKQLKTLVAKGDRKGVADLLQKYLPFEEMAPFEKRFWNTYLEVIRNPVPLDKRVLIYRGLSDDFLHLVYDGEKEVQKEEALKEGKTFLMSTVLVKNQGSWNRRLRSLETMNDKYIGTIKDSNEFSQSARISTMFMKHSSNPKGSPFLSFTPHFQMAKKFGLPKMMMGLIDPRLLHFNYASHFSSEIEFLMPLVTFPDEMGGLWHESYHHDIDRETHFNDRLKILIENEYGKGKSEDIIKNIKKNTADFFSPVYDKSTPQSAGIPNGTMAAFYKSFAKAHEFKPAFTFEGNITCKDLIKIFWAAP